LNFGKARISLVEAKNYLDSVIGEEGHQAGIKLDAHLLLAKLHYACGQFEKCLENFKLAELTTLSEKHLSPYVVMMSFS
jgi:tetratricopeptide repeat protein 7